MRSTPLGKLILIALITVTTLHVAYMSWLELSASSAFPRSPETWLRMLPVALPMALLGYAFLVPRPSTHACRRCGIFFVLACMASALILEPGRPMLMAPFLLILPGVSMFFLPARLLTLPPLLLALLPIYLMSTGASLVFSGITLLITTLAAFSFPSQRRIIEFWRPSRLPRPRPRGGVTLIELLVVVALISIMTAGFGHLVSITAISETRNRERAGALALAEDQIAILRGSAQLPGTGTHKLDARLVESDPAAAARGEYTIEPGPVEGSRLVRVSVKVGEPAWHEVRLAVILPVAHHVSSMETESGR